MKCLQSPFLAWLTCSLFFLFQYVLRVSPSVMMDTLREEFQVNADAYSTLGSYYLYAYAFAQIPLGLLVDRFGIRRITLLSLAVCIVGVMFCAYASSFCHLQMARILIGLGSGIAFTGALKVASDYFTPGKRGVLMGLTLTLGTMGAFVAGRPLVVLMDFSGWRDTFLLTSLLCLPLLLLSFLCLPSRQTGMQVSSLHQAVSLFQGILKNRNILIYTALAIGLYTPLSSLADLWGANFLISKYHFSLKDAALANTMMYVGMATGSVCLGWFFEARDRIDLGIKISGIIIMILMGVILYGSHFELRSIMVILVGMGFFCGAEMLCFTGASQYTTPETSGLTLGFVNTLNMLGGAVLQQMIGVGLDWQWSGSMTAGGLRMYSVKDYQVALSSLLILIVLCVSLSVFLRHKRSVKGGS